MLYTDPVTLDPPTEHTRIYRRRPADITTDTAGGQHEFEATAFHWGSLTTGHWLTAFWILLGPFAFANVAGWMTTRPGKWSHSAVRLAGMAMTALFVIQLGFLFLEAPLAMAPAGKEKVVVLASAAVYFLVYVVGIVMWLSTQSHFQGFGWERRLKLTVWPTRRHLLPPKFWTDPEVAEAGEQWDDPAGDPITSRTLWDEHAILHRIRRLHLGVGVLVMSALIAVGLDLAWMRWLVAGLSTVLILLMILTTTNPRLVVVQFATAWAPLVSVACFGVAYWQLIVSEPVTSPWPGYHVTTFVVALALGLAGAAATVSGWLSLGAIVIGTLFGASLGTGAAYIANSYAELDQLTENGAGWVAVAMLFLVLTIAITALILSFLGDIELPRGGKVMALLRRVTLRARTIFVVSGIFGLVAGGIAFAIGCVGTSCTPTDLGVPIRGGVVYLVGTIVLAVLTILLAARLFALNTFLALVVAVVGGVGVMLFAMGRLPTGQIAGYEVDFNDLVDVAKVLIVIMPVLLVGRSLVGSIRRGTSNRQVGIIWDVASLWPRWFHPLAPPGYGPKVVESLLDRLNTEKPKLLEAHSQGSVIAVVTLSQLADPDGMRLITYGSPLGLLYQQMFPRVGVSAMVSEVQGKLGSRWRNLWRPTDPLGGAPIGLGEGDIEIGDSTGHSGYELSSSFREARHQLVVD